jgi:hypothetical protein
MRKEAIKAPDALPNSIKAVIAGGVGYLIIDEVSDAAFSRDMVDPLRKVKQECGVPAPDNDPPVPSVEPSNGVECSDDVIAMIDHQIDRAVHRADTLSDYLANGLVLLTLAGMAIARHEQRKQRRQEEQTQKPKKEPSSRELLGGPQPDRTSVPMPRAYIEHGRRSRGLPPVEPSEEPADSENGQALQEELSPAPDQAPEPRAVPVTDGSDSLLGWISRNVLRRH